MKNEEDRFSAKEIFEAGYKADTKRTIEAYCIEKEKSKPLNRLWDVIGVAGSRLDDWEKAKFIESLSIRLQWSEESTLCSTVWDGLQASWDKGDVPNLDNTNPPLTESNVREVLNISLSHRECWQAIAEIAHHAQTLESRDGCIHPGPVRLGDTK